MHRRMLITESAEQIPHLTQTARGGKRMAMRPRKISAEHISGVSDEVSGMYVLVFEVDSYKREKGS